MKKNQKRYHTAEEITSEIDTKTEMIDTMRREAEEFESQAVDCCRIANEFPVNRALSKEENDERNDCINAAIAYREDAERIEARINSYKTRLERLKETLSAFQTEPMAILPEPSQILAPVRRTA